MSIFNRNKQKDTISNQYTSRYIDILSAYIGRSRIRQSAFFKDVLEGYGWFANFSEGFIRFGDDEYPIQLLGSESYKSYTWQWAIENTNNFSEDVLKDAYLLYNSSLMENIPDLKSIKLPLSDAINGHCISAIASAAHYEKTVYYRCPYDGGAVFVLVKNIQSSVFMPAGPSDVSKHIADLIKELPLNHRLLVKNMLMDNCESVEGTTTSLIGHFPGNSSLAIDFTMEGKLSNMRLASEGC
ncbi:MAG: hypothetical protein FWG30_10135 [Eubacteriaceae bacterium]|nr:hypothetical protein [Eubacteriaceae bacterium]